MEQCRTSVEKFIFMTFPNKELIYLFMNSVLSKVFIDIIVYHIYELKF